MRRILILTLLLVAASIVALQLKDQSGYILLQLREWSVETTLSFAVIATIVAFSILLFVIRLVMRFIHAPRDLRIWRERQRTRRARKQLTRGLIALAESDWKRAEKLLGRSAADSENPLMHYLGAANAAQHQLSDERRDHYLGLAHKETPKADFVIRLTQAEQQLGHKQYDDALNTLTQLKKQKPNHPKLLRLLAQTLTAQQQWEQLLKLIPHLRKQKSLGRDELSQLERHGQIQLLNIGAESEDEGALTAQWKNFSRSHRRDHRLVYHYATLLNSQGNSTIGEELLRKEIQHQWSDELVTLYGIIAIDKTELQIHATEKWLKHHAESAVLHLTLGRLYVRKEIWGQAQQHLEKSIEIAPSSEAYREMALLKRLGGDPAAALEYYDREAALLRDRNHGASSMTLQQPQMSQNRDDPQLAQLH